jgi:hypothetical protein
MKVRIRRIKRDQQLRGELSISSKKGKFHNTVEADEHDHFGTDIN